jgi:glutaredoxin
MFDALAILVVGILSFRGKISEKLFFIIVVTSLLFETIMLGYQYFASPEMCKFCMGVYGFLVVVTLLASKKYFLMVIPAIIGLVTALSFLAIPKSAPFVVESGNYLIQSPTCPHCKKVKVYLKEHNIEFTKLDIDAIEARNFATFLNFKTIPILLIKDGKRVEIINGDKNIIDFFTTKRSKAKESTVVGESAVVGDDTPNSRINLMESGDEGDEGCGFITLQKLDTNCSE